MDLDELLTRSAPPVTTRTPHLDGELRDLAAAAEQAARPRRRRLRVGVVGAVVVGVLGVGAASATGLVPAPGWVPWTSSSGKSCQMQLDVVPALDEHGNVINGEPLPGHFTQAEQQEALDEARSFLASYDYASIDRPAAIRAWKAAEAKVRASEPPGERQPILRGADIEEMAISRVVWRDLKAHLTAHGINWRLVVSGESWRCE